MEIRIDNVHKEFDRFPALNGVSLNIRSGELIALLGPSGSGKTTLLRLIAGLERPTSGAIYFGDENASNKSVQERNVGFVFQHYALFKHLTIADNIGFGLKVRPRSRRPRKDEIRRKASELLDLVQLSGLEKRFPAQLSGGQRQRVALARALAIDPAVLLLDEPFGALDARVRKDLRRWLRDLHDRTGHTTVFVTHDQEEALELADRVAILNLGKIEQIGSADDIYDRPASPFVISFVGDTNRLAVEAKDGQLNFEGRSFPTEIVGVAEGTGDFYARPEDIQLVDHEGASLTGVVTHVHRTANGRRTQVELGSSKSLMEVETPTSANLKSGERVGVRIRKGWFFGAPAAGSAPDRSTGKKST